MNVLRKLLLPIVPIYYLVTWLRNKLYDFGVKKSRAYDFPIIAVGNLSVGGTGKSPMVEYLIRLLKDSMVLATLSRGYKRESKGFQLVKTNATVSEVGDEPLQFKTKFTDVFVGVDENRRNGIHQLRSLKPRPEVLVLDDAYQHRKVKAGFYILLTSYHDLYSDDIVLPTGNLREPRKGADRANIIVVTKCPKNLSIQQQQHISKKLKNKKHQALFFSSISYGDEIVCSERKKTISSIVGMPFTLVTGIANPTPIVDYYTSLGLQFDHIAFADHHNFTDTEIVALKKKPFIITTEKDYMRLAPYFSDQTVWYQPITLSFINDDDIFDKQIIKYVTSNAI